jgi:hypothetical protein
MKNPRTDDVYRPAIPLAYVQLNLDDAARNGVPREQLIHGLGLSRSLLGAADARVSRHDAGTILLRAIRGSAGIRVKTGRILPKLMF